MQQNRDELGVWEVMGKVIAIGGSVDEWNNAILNSLSVLFPECSILLRASFLVSHLSVNEERGEIIMRSPK